MMGDVYIYDGNNCVVEVQGGQSAEILEEILGTGIFAADGEQWKRHRKVASSQFSTRKIREFSNTVFREDSLHLVHLLDRAMVAHEPVNFQVLDFIVIPSKTFSLDRGQCHYSHVFSAAN